MGNLGVMHLCTQIKVPKSVSTFVFFLFRKTYRIYRTGAAGDLYTKESISQNTKLEFVIAISAVFLLRS